MKAKTTRELKESLGEEIGTDVKIVVGNKVTLKDNGTCGMCGYQGRVVALLVRTGGNLDICVNRQMCKQRREYNEKFLLNAVELLEKEE